jgi:peroxiredoxin
MEIVQGDIMEIGQVVGGEEREEGVFLNVISSINDETCSIEVKEYNPDHAEFAWALQQLKSIEA